MRRYYIILGVNFIDKNSLPSITGATNWHWYVFDVSQFDRVVAGADTIMHDWTCIRYFLLVVC
jgi:hypothetical protein